MAERSLRFDLEGRDKSLGKTLDQGRRKVDKFGRDTNRQLGRGGDDAGKKFGVRFNKRLGGGFSASTKIATVAAGAIGGAFAAVQIGGFLKGAIDEAREAAKVGRQTAAVIKATGGVAKVSARDVDRLSDRLSGLVAVDDEIIAAGANMLLTFKGVRNEVGKGNDIFNQASSVILDMTAALHQGEVSQQGLEKASIQVGKALNDPIKGITALQRVGVTFTQKQKDQIKTLVESGKTMEAQKIILAELASEFGGAAKAAADPWQRVGVVMGNVKEDIGTLLLPVIEDVSVFIADKLVPAARGFADKHGPAFGRAFSNAGDAIGDLITKAQQWWQQHGPAVKQAFDDARVAVFGVRGELDKIKKSWDDNKTAIQGVVGSTKELTGEGGLPTLSALVKGAGEELRGIVTIAGWVARGYKFLSDASQAAAKLQVGAVTFIAEAFRGLFNLIFGINHKIIAGAATVAEALHLPIAGSLRKAEQKFGEMQKGANQDLDRVIGGVRATQRAIDRLHGKNVNITGTTSLQFTKTFTKSDWNAARLAAGRMAGGGKITSGTGPTADDVLLWGSKGEAMVPARSASKPEFKAWAAAEGIPGFALGGPLGGVAQTGVAHAGVGKQMDRWGTARMAALIKSLVGGAGSPAIKAFIRSTDPLNYGWGGAGPNVYDCSGITGAVALAMRGKPYGHGQRVWTTSSIRPGILGLKSGLGGTLQIGVTAGTGHMAGRYGGLGFEAESTRTGIKVGAAASRPESFARHFHMAKGGAIDAELLERFARLTRADVGGDFGRLRINGRVFDRGGYLMPGTTVATNRTGKPERVVGPQETMTVNLTPAAVRALGRVIIDGMVAAGVGAVNLDSRRANQILAGAGLSNDRRR